MNGLELTKSQKKIARQVIETGLAREYGNGIKKISKIIRKSEDDKSIARETYMEMYKSLTSFDKQLARRYDRMTGSNYLWIIAGQLADGIISVNELQDFDEEVQQKLILMSRIDED